MANDLELSRTSVGLADRYKLIFEEHRFASEYRLKILAVWGATYAGLAAVFFWAESAARPLSFVVTVLAAILTVLLWIGDARNRSAIGRSKDVGTKIEASSDIPKNQWFFAALDSNNDDPGLERGRSFTRGTFRYTHSKAIDWFTRLMLVVFVGATPYLFLRSAQPNGSDKAAGVEGDARASAIPSNVCAPVNVVTVDPIESVPTRRSSSSPKPTLSPCPCPTNVP